MKMSVQMLVAAAGLCAAGMAQGQVKISQVYGGGGNTGAQYNRDFVELFNSGNAPVSLNGWSIQYMSATSTAAWTSRNLPNVSIPAGGYYLIQMTLTGAVGAALPTPDFTVATAVAMSATDGKVALVQNTTALTGACPGGAIEDLVGFGTTNCSEGPATPDLSNTTAAFRLLDGCFDTNRNNSNFVVGAPAPRNSATAINVCSGTFTDLGVSIAGGGCGVGLAAPVAYTITVNNYGSVASDGTVTFNIPSNTSFVSSVPAGAPVGNTLTVVLPAIPAGGSDTLTVNLNTTSQGSQPASASVASSVNDPGTANNAANGAPVYVIPTTATARAIFSNNPALANSDVPAGVSSPAKFILETGQSEVFGRPFPSADNSRVVFRGVNNLGTTLDHMLITFPIANPSLASTVVQEGVTDLGAGELVGIIDSFPSINNDGDIAFSTASSAAAASNGVVVLRTIAGAYTVVAREGSNNGVGNPIGGTATAFGITSSDQVLYWHLGPVVNTSDQHVMLGASQVAREGSDIPANQVAAATNAWGTFDQGSDLGQSQDVSSDGVNTLLSGTLEAGTTDPEVLVLNNNVVLMDGSTIPGVAGTVTDIRFAELYSGANWSAYGGNGTQDWVVINGSLLTQTDAPMTPGNTETWDDAIYAQTFFVAAANPNGTYVVGGVTSSTDANNNAAIVLNGRIVLVRENDPVDLNNDGVFNDDAYIRTFRDDRFLLLNDALYFAAELRNAAGYCSGNTKTGDAFIRVAVPCPADLDNDGIFTNGGQFDGGVDISDLLYFLAGFEAGSVDLDNDGDPSIGIPDGGTDINDLLFYLNRFENGC